MDTNKANFKDYIEWYSKNRIFRTAYKKTPNVTFDARGLQRTDNIPSYLKKIAEDELISENNYDVNQFLFELENYHHVLNVLDRIMYDNKNLMDAMPKAYAGLSFITVTHSFIREFGAFTLSKDSGLEDDVYNDVFFDFIGSRWHIDNSKPVYPRGKNTGAPVIVSGKERVLNNVILTLNAAIAEIAWQKFIEQKFDEFSRDVKMIYDIIATEFADPAYLVFSRYQFVNATKDIPKYVNGLGWLLTQGIEARRRIINSTPKPFAMLNKHVITYWTSSDLKTAEFQADPAMVRKRIQDHISKYGINTIIALDHSRFDLRHGGRKMAVALKQMAKFTIKYMFPEVYNSSKKDSAIEALYFALSTESFLPTYLIDRGVVFKGDGKLVIKSGDSKTSRLDSYIALCEDMYITSKSLNLSFDQTVEYYKKFKPSSILGDDVIKFFPNEEHKNRYVEYMVNFSKAHNVVIEIEEPTMYLGKIIVPRKPNYINRMENLIMKYCFPERKKTPIALPIQVIARKELLKESGYSVAQQEFLVKLLCQFNETIVNNKRLKRHDISQAYEFWLKYNINITKPRDVHKAYDWLIKDPKNFGLENVYAAADEIIHTFGKGLEHYIDLSLIGLPDKLNNIGKIAYPDFLTLYDEEFSDMNTKINDDEEYTRTIKDRSQILTLRKQKNLVMKRSQMMVLDKLREMVIDMVKSKDISKLRTVYQYIKTKKYELNLVHRGYNDFISQKIPKRLILEKQIKNIKKRSELSDDQLR